MKCDIHLVTKVTALICGALIIAMSVNRFANMQFTRFQNFILTVHYIWLGAVLVLAELRFAYVHSQFRLLTSFCGRGVYCIFLGTLMITENSAFQIAVATIMFIVGCGYFVLQMLSRKYGWQTEQPKNPYAIPSNNDKAPQAYQPPYNTNVNFQSNNGPALK